MIKLALILIEGPGKATRGGVNRSQFKIQRFELLAFVQIQSQRTSAQTPRLHVLEKITLTLGVLGRLTQPLGSKAMKDGTHSSLHRLRRSDRAGWRSDRPGSRINSVLDSRRSDRGPRRSDRGTWQSDWEVWRYDRPHSRTLRKTVSWRCDSELWRSDRWQTSRNTKNSHELSSHDPPQSKTQS